MGHGCTVRMPPVTGMGNGMDQCWNVGQATIKHDFRHTNSVIHMGLYHAVERDQTAEDASRAVGADHPPYDEPRHADTALICIESSVPRWVD